MNILIKTIGFIGDNLFASSIAKKLKEQRVCNVDYLISVVQPYELLRLNPYIDNVFLSVPDKSYDIIYNLTPINRKITPCEQFQKQCNVELTSSEYTVYTNPSLDEYISYLFANTDKKIVAYQSNWEERSFQFSEQEYIRGVDVPNLGYGGKHRNIQNIISDIRKQNDIFLIEVGKPQGTSATDIDISSVSEYTLTASILKNCDYFIGAEGGLCNLAAGVGTNTIITGDFIHQLYGWNGVIEKNQEPKLGPKYYFGNTKHTTLCPYLSDKDVAENIIKLITK